MPRGGRRQGSSGKSYTNRTDLAVDRAPTAPAATVAAQPQQQAAWVSPDAVPSPTDPTTHPGRPPTYGAPGGPGAGPEVLSMRGAFTVNPGMVALRRAYAATQDESIRRVLEYYEGLGY
jgi:hypothetical protein